MSFGQQFNIIETSVICSTADYFVTWTGLKPWSSTHCLPVRHSESEGWNWGVRSPRTPPREGVKGWGPILLHETYHDNIFLLEDSSIRLKEAACLTLNEHVILLWSLNGSGDHLVNNSTTLTLIKHHIQWYTPEIRYSFLPVASRVTPQTADTGAVKTASMSWLGPLNIWTGGHSEQYEASGVN